MPATITTNLSQNLYFSLSHLPTFGVYGDTTFTDLMTVTIFPLTICSFTLLYHFICQFVYYKYSNTCISLSDSIPNSISEWTLYYKEYGGNWANAGKLWKWPLYVYYCASKICMLRCILMWTTGPHSRKWLLKWHPARWILVSSNFQFSYHGCISFFFFFFIDNDMLHFLGTKL